VVGEEKAETVQLGWANIVGYLVVGEGKNAG